MLWSALVSTFTPCSPETTFNYNISFVYNTPVVTTVFILSYYFILHLCYYYGNQYMVFAHLWGRGVYSRVRVSTDLFNYFGMFSQSFLEKTGLNIGWYIILCYGFYVYTLFVHYKHLLNIRNTDHVLNISSSSLIFSRYMSLIFDFSLKINFNHYIYLI